MSTKPFDKTTKTLSRVFLLESGLVEDQKEIRPHTLWADVFFTPDKDKIEQLLQLGLFGQIASEALILEAFYNAPQPEDLKICLAKREHLVRQSQREEGTRFQEPWLWLICGQRPQNLIEHYRFVPLSIDHDLQGGERNWPHTGVYETYDVLRTRMVVVSELPKSPETFLVRLLGRGPYLKQAMRELSERADDSDSMRRLFAALLEYFQQIEPIPEAQRPSAQEDFMVNAKDIFGQTQLAKDIEQKSRLQGRQEGLQEGRQEGQTELFLKLVQARFPKELTEAQIKTIQEASSDRIDTWVQGIFDATSLQSLLSKED